MKRTLIFGLVSPGLLLAGLAVAQVPEADNLQQQYQSFLMALPRQPDSAWAAFNAGVLALKMEDWPLAEKHFRQVLSISDLTPQRQVRAQYNLAFALLSRQDIRRAELREACQLLDAARLTLTNPEQPLPGMERLAEDVAVNLAIAQRRLEAMLRKPEAGPESAGGESPRDKAKSKQGQDGKNPAQTDKNKNNKPKVEDVGPQQTTEADRKNARESDRKPTPGAGGKEAIPIGRDENLTPEQAGELLQKAAQRLEKDRQRVRQSASESEQRRPNNW